jgi:hypothetical protein
MPTANGRASHPVLQLRKAVRSGQDAGPELGSGQRLSAVRTARLFASETSCESGNRWLDRAVLADLPSASGLAFPLR